jgi:sulfite reductase (NADPH) hemoprotein beta-component
LIYTCADVILAAASFFPIGTVKVLTANRLAPGEVIYWSGPAGWQPALQQAYVLDDAAAEAALKQAAEWVQRCEIVAPYVFPVRLEGGHIVPVSAREMIRANGPSVRTDVGKQAA